MSVGCSFSDMFPFPPAPNDERYRKHRTRCDKPAVLHRPETVNVDVDSAFAVEVIQHHHRAIVDEVHDDARPKRTSDVKHVAQQ